MSSVQILKVENVNVEIFSRLEEKRVEENNSILSPLCGNNRSYIDTPLLFLHHKQGFSMFRIHFLFRLVHTYCDGTLFFITSSTRVQIFSVSECRQVPKVLFTSGQEGPQHQDSVQKPKNHTSRIHCKDVEGCLF